MRIRGAEEFQHPSILAIHAFRGLLLVVKDHHMAQQVTHALSVALLLQLALVPHFPHKALHLLQVLRLLQNSFPLVGRGGGGC